MTVRYRLSPGRKSGALALLGLLGALGAASPLAAQLQLPPEQPIRIGRFPALSPDGSTLCFSWQGNLWTSPAAGGPATRLTANDSYDSNPRWSPDGKWIAFNSDREGGTQVFLIPAVGGPARQVTFHSSATAVADWFPDSQSLAVTSVRDTRNSSIYRLDVPSGRLKLLVTDETACFQPSISPDGKWVAYTRGALVDLIRKNYRGAANFDIYVAPVDRSAPPRRITDSDKNDMWPAWSADSKSVYYSSERAGTATVWKSNREGGKPEVVFNNPPDAVRYLNASRNGQLLTFECDNWICTVSPTGGSPKQVSILCRTDERGPRTTFANITNQGVTEFALSPDGKRVAFGLRGDLFTVALDKGGEARRLTDTPTRDREITWAPDGKTLVYSSNRDGEYKLYKVDAATRETTPLTKGAGTDSDPAFSPDGKWIAFRRGPQTALYVIRPDGTGEQVAIKGPNVGEFKWSPDGKWLSVEREDEIRTNDLWIASVTAEGEGVKFGEPFNVTDYPGYNFTPRWFPDGSRMAFISNRNRARDIETINDRGRFSLYTVPLEREKEKFEEDEDAPKPPAPAAPAPAAPAAPMPAPAPAGPKKVEVKIEPREIERRAKLAVQMEPSITSLSVSPDSRTLVFSAGPFGGGDIWTSTVDGGALQKVVNGEGAQDFQWSPDGSRFYYVSGGAIRSVPRAGGAPSTVAFTVRMEIDRLVDYKAVFDEAWQVMNEVYYDKTFHGVDWKATGAKYRSLVDHVSSRRDLNYLVTQMLGELNSSHTGFSGGVTARPARATGYLGIWADDSYEGAGIKIREVLDRGPADRDESRLKAGEYLLEIDGKDVRYDASYDRALAEKVGRTVTLLVNDKPQKEGARRVKIRPISAAAWNPLMYERWIDQRRAMVERASGGRAGYLHVDDMGDEARNRFERELFSVGMRKEAMVIDVRDNSGGDTHDSLLRILARNKHYFTFAPRREVPFQQPERAYTKPIILLTNGGSLSDAEVFANGWKELKLGKVVGQPTMGWIIFTSGQRLVDGSTLRTPHIGCYTLDGKDLENWGVPPDISVENTPADVLAGKDPQLQRGVEELLKDPRLKK